MTYITSAKVTNSRRPSYSLRGTEWYQVVLVEIVLILLKESEIVVVIFANGLELFDGGFDSFSNTRGGVSSAVPLQLQQNESACAHVTANSRGDTYDVDLKHEIARVSDTLTNTMIQIQGRLTWSMLQPFGGFTFDAAG